LFKNGGNFKRVIHSKSTLYIFLKFGQFGAKNLPRRYGSDPLNRMFKVTLTILGASVLFLEQNITIEKVYRVLEAALHMRWACDAIPSKLVIWQKYAESEKAVRVFLRGSHIRRNIPEEVKCDLSKQLLIPGKVTCLSGVVGCGKTTLIHSVLG
jgi:hypothetical protein